MYCFMCAIQQTMSFNEWVFGCPNFLWLWICMCRLYKCLADMLRSEKCPFNALVPFTNAFFCSKLLTSLLMMTGLVFNLCCIYRLFIWNVINQLGVLIYPQIWNTVWTTHYQIVEESLEATFLLWHRIRHTGTIKMWHVLFFPIYIHLYRVFNSILPLDYL